MHVEIRKGEVKMCLVLGIVIATTGLRRLKFKGELKV